MGIAGNEWGFQVGTLPKGARDKISDVPGVTVGHCTLADGVVQTGVTALLPHQGNVFHEKVLAASYVNPTNKPPPMMFPIVTGIRLSVMKFITVK